MQKIYFKYIFLLLAISVVSCAKRGSITGGLKDTLSPKMVSSFPKNRTTNFNGKEIKIYFDEYIKLKNINKQLVVSPPMKKQPEILPYSASKFISIKIKDTLLPNTTYSFNFGKSIEDNNEGNPYQQFKYVFSTGSYIDSLSLDAKVKDAIALKVDNYVSLMLYEVNEKYNDSTIYKQVPRYISNTLDSLKVVKFDNIKDGKYQLIAVKDVNGNNKYDPKTDKIGFQKDYITLPNDTLYELELFKEIPVFKAVNVSQASGSRFTIGYEGNAKDIKLAVKKGGKEIPFVVSQFPKKDSLQVWVNAIKGDSLDIAITKNNYKKSFLLKIKAQKKDTIGFSAEQSGALAFRNTFTINTVTPLSKWDESKMKLINKDSAVVKFTTEYDAQNQKLKFNFEKQPLEKYNLKVFPGAITDFYERKNDTLSYDFTTNNTSDYGNLRLVLENVKRYPIIIELTDKEGKVLASQYSEKSNNIVFDLLEPTLFTVRVIYDDNKDREWTPGSFIEKRQSEEVIYFPKQIDVRANWDVEQPFDIGTK
ncbi:Ig-like domain-containing protein [Flavobacterium sp.]|uniref:Ig-like domain-containing protein n=1 Tax=Flavobacterium sp. TaxID=239 RepID=UPI003750B010